MINTIIESISAALQDEFGDGYEIRMEESEQGMEKPCFFIFCKNPSNERFPGNRYFRTNPFCIQYFPVSGEKQRECNRAAERMYQCLEHVTVKGDDKPIMGTKMRYEVVDGVLNFFVNYDMFMIRQQKNEGAMEKVTGSVTAKG